MQLAEGACAFKTQTVVFCVKRRKAGRFFMQKAATKILKPLDKYNGGIKLSLVFFGFGFDLSFLVADFPSVPYILFDFNQCLILVFG